MRIGVLDFRHPSWTLAFAPIAERVGFTRYWVGEHHGHPEQSGSPGILTSLVAALTTTMRVGPGGVLAMYQSPYKVAQDHRVLVSVFGTRIDLGIARGPGADGAVVDALLDGRSSAASSFDARVTEISRLLRGDLPPGHPLHGTSAPGDGLPPPHLWILGASHRSASLAADIGASFAYSVAIATMTGTERDGPGIIEAYRTAFAARHPRGTPQVLLSVSGSVVPSGDTAPATVPMAGHAPLVAPGDVWRAALDGLAGTHDVDEFMFLELASDDEAAARSLHALAEATGIVGSSTAA